MRLPWGHNGEREGGAAYLSRNLYVPRKGVAMTASPLTPRQLEACALYAQGLGTGAVADRMGIKRAVVRHYLDVAKQRMGAKRLGQLMFILGKAVRK